MFPSWFLETGSLTLLELVASESQRSAHLSLLSTGITGAPQHAGNFIIGIGEANSVSMLAWQAVRQPCNLPTVTCCFLRQQEHSRYDSSLQYFFLRFVFILCTYFACVYVCVPCACLVSMYRAEESVLYTWNYNYRLL